MSQLPKPHPEALQHSAQLQAMIAKLIHQSGGWIDFAAFMQLALYWPDLGYYSHLGKKFGESGDFITAPELSALFGQCIARHAMPILKATQGQLLELGAGSGKLAIDLISALNALGCPPAQYFILEVSAGLREMQQQRLKQALATTLFNKVVWLDTLPQSISGFILANEVLDALPVHVIHHQQGQLFECGVQVTEQAFTWANQPLSNPELLAMAQALSLPEDYTTELNPSATGLVKSMADCLKDGAMLWIDYGFSQSEYYHPQRRQGTLMCHYQHHAHDNPLIYAGLQDITAHVDFTAIAKAGLQQHMHLDGYTNQAQFLINCGITDILSLTSANDVSEYLPLVSQAQKLLSPAEMGELFKVIGFSKKMDSPMLGFKSGNKAHTL